MPHTEPRAPEEESPRPARVELLLLVLVAAAIQFPSLTREGLWFDEIFSVVTASQDLPGLWRRAVADQTNPPGFYLLLWGWIGIGGLADGWLRLLPALAGILLAPATALLAAELGAPRRAALASGLLATASPLLLALGLEVRTYSWLALMATVALTVASRTVRAAAPGAPPARTIAPLAVLDVALVALHYFGAFAVAAQLALLARTRRERLMRDTMTLVVAALPAALALAAWVSVVVRHADPGRVGVNAGWIPPVTVSTFANLAFEAIGVLATPAAAIGILLLLGLALALPWIAPDRGEHRAAGRVASLAALIPLPLVWIADSVTGRDLVLARYLVASIPPALVAVAILVERTDRAIRPLGRLPLLTTALVGWALTAGLHSVAARGRKPDWARITAELARRPVTLCTNEEYVALPLKFYATRDRLDVRVEDMRGCAPPEGGWAWAVYRRGTESSLGVFPARDVRLGQRLDLVTELPETSAIKLGF